MSEQRVLSPSELTDGPNVSPIHAGSTVRIGGRVLALAGDIVTVADALGQVEVELFLTRDAAPLRPGELVVVEGARSGRSLRRARLLERHPAPEPRGDGDIARFLLGRVGQKLAARSRAIAALRAYFAEQQFIEVETPVRVHTPGLDANVDAIGAQDGFLVTSPELHMKRLLVGGMPRIYQLARCSRADESGRWHEPEFLMLEWYRAFAGEEAMLADTEAIVRRVTQVIGGAQRIALADGRRIDVRKPFLRLSVREAFQRYAAVEDAVALARAQPERYFELLVGKVEPALATLLQPVFLHRFPATQAALARRCPDDASVAERFELYLGGVELCNGFGELTDPVEQRLRFEDERSARAARGGPVYAIDERFMSALDAGMPPSAGNALGVDRLVALALGEPSIDGVVAFRWTP